MKKVDIISNIVARKGEALATPSKDISKVNLSGYLLKSIWDKVWEIRTDSQGAEYIFGKLPVVTQYGITMYSANGVDVPSLASGLPFDRRTIWYNPDTKQIEVIGGTGGGSGEGVSNFWDLSGIPSWITRTKPKYAYSEIEGTPDLSVFATQNWIISQGYASAAELKKYIPISGYTEVSGEKNFVGGLKVNGSPIYYDTEKKYWKLDGDLLVTGGITMYGSDSSFTPSTIMDALLYDDTTLGINSEGELYVKGGTGGGLDITALQNYLTQNSYLNVTEGDNRYLKLSGGTISGTYGALTIHRTNEKSSLIKYSNTSGVLGHLGFNSSKEPIVYKGTDTNRSYKIWHTGNDGEDSGLDADMLDGVQLNELFSSLSSGSTNKLSITIGGVTKSLETLYASYTDRFRAVWNNPTSGTYELNDFFGGYVRHYGSGGRLNNAPSSFGNGAVLALTNGMKGLSGQLAWNIVHNSTTNVTNKLWWRAADSTNGFTYSQWKQIAFTDSNVASATKLETARTIWGKSFDGTADIDGKMTFTTKTLSRSAINYSSDSLIFSDDKAETIIRGAAIKFQNATGTNAMILSGGNLGVGTTSPSSLLDVNGDASITGQLNLPTTGSGAFNKPQILLGGGMARIGVSSTGFMGIYSKTSIRLSQDSETAVSSTGLWVYTGGFVGINNSAPTHTLDVSGTLNATGAATMKSTLGVTGTSTFTGKTTHNGGIKTPSIVGNGSHLSIGNSTDAEFAYIKAYQDLMGYDATGANKWSITTGGVASFVSMSMASLSVTGASSLGSLTAGATTLSNVIVSTTSRFIGNTTHESNAYFANGTTYYVDASGAAKFASLTSAGAISGTTGSFSSTLSVTGATTLGSTLSVTGATTLKSTLKGNYWYLNNSATNSYLRLNRKSSTSSYWYVQSGDGYMALGGPSASVSMKIDAEGNVIIPGNLLVKGGITMYDTSGSAPATELYTKRLVLTDTSSSSVFNDKGIMFGEKGVARISTTTSNALGLYAGGQIYLRPNSLTAASSVGMILNTAGNAALSGGMTIGAATVNSKVTDGTYTLHVTGNACLVGNAALSGGITIGATTVNSNVTNGTYKLHVTGSAYLTGTLMQNSDTRYKTIHKDLELGLQTMAEAPCFEYHFNDDERKVVNVGTSAQYWQCVDGVTRTNEDGRFGMDYSSLGVVMAISLAKELSKYETKTDKAINKLKKRICELEEEIERLKCA